MAGTPLTAARKGELADELTVAASWLGGPRQVKLLAIAEELRGADPEKAIEQATRKLAAESAPTAKVEEEAAK